MFLILYKVSNFIFVNGVEISVAKIIFEENFSSRFLPTLIQNLVLLCLESKNKLASGCLNNNYFNFPIISSKLFIVLVKIRIARLRVRVYEQLGEVPVGIVLVGGSVSKWTSASWGIKFNPWTDDFFSNFVGGKNLTRFSALNNLN